MGIRGAWSVVSKDPNRFGEAWVCSNQSIVWIDGPSLVYHLSLYPKYGNVETFGCHLNQKGQASPSDIHKRTQNFITVLSNIAKEVHVVMDGVCKSSKTQTQVNRMESNAQLAKDIVRSCVTPLNCHVISILADWSMVEAIEKIKCSIPNLYLHRPLRMEAETFIDAHLASRNEDVVVMSDDSDYLIYKHCPGFIPFKSLQFTQEGDEISTLTGFQYVRSKFCRALFSDEADYRLLSTLAALAGCDYSNEILESAQAVIIKSDIGGLRVKHQNTPTAATTFQAVVRYIYHFKIMNKDSWMKEMISRIDIDCILESLDLVHQIYFSEKCSDCIANSQPVEFQRLFEDRTLYCKPFLESFSSPRSEPLRSSASKRAKRTRGKRKKRKGGKPARLKQDELESTKVSKSLPYIECVNLDNAATCKTIDEVKECLRKDSVWTLTAFQNSRREMYYVLNSMKWMKASVHVTEWRRIDHQSQAKYQEYHIPIFLIQQEECDEVKSITQVSNICVYAASLLPGKSKWLFLLLISSPDSLRRVSSENTSVLDATIANLLTVAYYHAKLYEEVALVCHSKRISQPLSHLEKIDMVLAEWIWSVLCNSDVCDLPENFFHNPKVVELSEHAEWLSQFKLVTRESFEE